MVVKVGGEVLDSEGFLQTLVAQLCAWVVASGGQLVLVHGGGKLVSQRLRESRIEPKFVRGLRVTDERTMAVVEAVLAQEINPDLVSAINRVASRSGSREAVGMAVGMADGMRAVLLAAPLREREAGGHDYGRVGRVETVRTDLLREAVRLGRVPVLAPIGRGEDGGSFNINADAAAAAVASALGADRLLLLSDVDGVLGADGQCLASLDVAQAQGLIADGVVSDGMIPKVEQALAAVCAGVAVVQILNGCCAEALRAALPSDTAANADGAVAGALAGTRIQAVAP